MTSLESVQPEIAQLQAKLDKARQSFRPPPPVPTTCCGRGCNGCVWEGYFAAAAWWVEEVEAILIKNLSLHIVSQGDNIQGLIASNPTITKAF